MKRMEDFFAQGQVRILSGGSLQQGSPLHAYASREGAFPALTLSLKAAWTNTDARQKSKEEAQRILKNQKIMPKKLSGQER